MNSIEFQAKTIGKRIVMIADNITYDWAIIVLIGPVNIHYWIAILNLLFSLLYYLITFQDFNGKEEMYHLKISL